MINHHVSLQAAVKPRAEQLHLLAEAGGTVSRLEATAAPVSEEADAVAIAVDEREEGGERAGHNDDNDELEEGEGGEGDGATVAGRLVVEDVAGGAGGVRPGGEQQEALYNHKHFQKELMGGSH